MSEDLRPVRVRIAPSPTGDPHVGTAYTALFNLAFARGRQGTFVLRIEDTDRNRFVPESEAAIFQALRWVGLNWDEGPDVGGPFAPYRQSERLPMYTEHAQRLVVLGHAYPCFCTPDRLERMRAEQQARGEIPHYDRRCRSLTPEEVAQRRAEGQTEVIRFAMPIEGETSWHDLVRGPITFQNSNLQDPVIMKSDGYPTYHLAATVDDHLMEISHVARGEEWIPSTPIHIQLYRASGWNQPEFAHIPVLRNAKRQKLSKRRDPTSILRYRDRGYLPEALLNFLGQLGWTMPDGREIFGFEDVAANFNWPQMQPAGAFFDLQRLDWFNGEYIRALTAGQLAERLQPWVPGADLAFLQRVAPLLHERITVLGDASEMLAFFFQPPQYQPDALVAKGRSAGETRDALVTVAECLRPLPEWTGEAILAGVREQAEGMGWKVKNLFAPTLYVAITGSPRSLPLTDSMAILGREESLRRIEAAAAALAGSR